jgi:hypothetical protein
MSRLAIRLSLFALCCATAVVAVPVFASGEAQAATRHAHVKKHPRHWHHAGQPWFGEPRPYVAPSQSGWVCPGIGRSFECKIWPPPFEDDPDRKTSKY